MKASQPIYLFLLVGLLHGLCSVARAEEQGEGEAPAAAQGAGKSIDKEAGKAEEKADPGGEKKAGAGGEKKAVAGGEKKAGASAEKTEAGGSSDTRMKQKGQSRSDSSRPAQGKGEKAGGEEKEARFVDRDGDGIRDGQEHRFRGRNRRGKHGQSGMESRQQQMVRHKKGASQTDQGRRMGR